MTDIRGGRSQEYLLPLQRLNDNMRTRTEVAGILKQFRLENIRHKFLSEEQAAFQHFEVFYLYSVRGINGYLTKLIFLERKTAFDGYDF